MLTATIARFGLLAVFVGAGVEGEPFALAGGVLAARGIAPLWAAIAAAVGGALAIDLFWFALGRRHRGHRWVCAARRRPAFARAVAAIERRPVLAIALFRFAYGIRAVAPVAVGVSAVPAARFLAIEAAACAVWGTGFTLLGRSIGAALPNWVAYLAIAGSVLGLALLGGGFVRSGRGQAPTVPRPRDPGYGENGRP